MLRNGDELSFPFRSKPRCDQVDLSLRRLGCGVSCNKKIVACAHTHVQKHMHPNKNRIAIVQTVDAHFL